jgi:hypothetical protein
MTDENKGAAGAAKKKTVVTKVTIEMGAKENKKALAPGKHELDATFADELIANGHAVTAADADAEAAASAGPSVQKAPKAK